MLLRSTLILAGIGAVAIGLSALQVFAKENPHWSTARWDSAGIAPHPAVHYDALVLIYGARAHGWRGIFGVHTGIAWKPEGASTFRRADVVGWGVRRGADAVRIRQGTPDNYWAGNPPFLIGRIEGAEAAAAIPKIEALIEDYPDNHRYRIWPGPNSKRRYRASGPKPVRGPRGSR